MAAADVEYFIRFFREFFDLCISQSLPDNSIGREEIRNMFFRAAHIEKSVKKMESEKNCIKEFLALLNSKEHFTDTFLQNCLCDPPKYILRKIINSNTDIKKTDIAFFEFQNVFSEERLTKTLSELMVEAASKEVLLKNMKTELPEHILQEFYCKLN